MIGISPTDAGASCEDGVLEKASELLLLQATLSRHGLYDFTFVNDCFATKDDHDTRKFCLDYE